MLGAYHQLSGISEGLLIIPDNNEMGDFMGREVYIKSPLQGCTQLFSIDGCQVTSEQLSQLAVILSQECERCLDRISPTLMSATHCWEVVIGAM